MTNDILVSFIIIACLLVISAFFSGSETSLTATSRARMHELERRGNRRAGIVQQLTSMRERLIGTVLLGNNVVNIAASALATSVLLQIFGDAGVIYATIGMTLLVLIFGEVLPKTYAIINADRVALFVAPLVRVLVTIFSPIVMTIEYVVKRTLRLFGADISRANQVLSAHDELRGAIALHHREGSVVKKDRDMLGGILDLQDLTVSDVMVHRTKMVTLERTDPPESIIDGVLKSGHTRIPIWKDSPENIIGILHAKDLLKELQKHRGDASQIDLEEIISPPW
ncbi:MAG: HlyC/CorC family transporter, partial [Aestuariivirgaceae bacterium]